MKTLYDQPVKLNHIDTLYIQVGCGALYEDMKTFSDTFPILGGRFYPKQLILGVDYTNVDLARLPHWFSEPQQRFLDWFRVIQFRGIYHVYP